MPKRPSPLFRTLGELRRRHVFRVVAAYAVCIFILLQVMAIVLPALHAPDWIISVLVVLGILGLPVVAVLTWVYDITPQGVVRTAPATDDEHEAIHWNWRWLDYLIIAGLLGIIIFVLMRDGPGEYTPDHSIAVLPFTDLSPEGDNRYFSDGMAEALIDSLARIPELQIAARTSSFSFRDSGKGVRQVAEELGVGTVLEGSVRKAGDRFRISARLVDGKRGVNLWNETYAGTLDDIFRVQDNIARAITDVLQIRLLGDLPLVQAPTQDQEAYEYYLRGRNSLRQEGTIQDVDDAIEYFERALDRDRRFTLASAGLCTAYWEKYELTRDPALAEHAIESCGHAADSDDDLAEIRIALGNLYRGTGRPEQSLLELNRALETNPNNAEAHARLGETLRLTGDLEGAEKHLRRAIELDPAYWRHHWDLGRVHSDQGRPDEAIVEMKHSIRLKPDSPSPYYSLGGIYASLGEHLKAADTLRQSIERYPTPAGYSNAGTQYFYAGDHVQAEAMYRQAVELSPLDPRFHGFLADAIWIQPDRDPQEAAVHYQTAIHLGYQRLKINPGDHLTRATIAGYLALTGEIEDAHAELEILAEAENLDMLTHRSMGMANLYLGHRNAAIRDFAKAVAKGMPKIYFSDPRLESLFDEPEFRAMLQGNEVPP